MTVTLCAGALTRRRFLTTAASSGALVAVGGIAKPALSRAADRPVITHGIQSGDVSVDSGVVWARADRPSRMLVEVATSDSFKTIRSEVFVDALPETDFTAKALIEGLPAGQDIFYRVRLQDHSFPTVLSAPQVGHFRTAPSERRTVSFVWSGDTAGGGWGIDEARGGMRTYSTMLRCRPDFFIHSGDHIYADCPIAAEQKLPNGETWKNVVIEDKSRVAQTLADFRPEPARLQRRGPAVCAVGRSRGHQRLVSGSAARLGRLRRQQHPQARRARMPRLPRVHAHAGDAG
jgi:alkaline phosphatase D